jgi:hypothetical protein
MLDFHLDVADIQLALASAEVIEEYDDDAQLVLGRSGTQALHVRHRPLECDLPRDYRVFARSSRLGCRL